MPISGVAPLSAMIALPARIVAQDSVIAFQHVAAVPMDQERVLHDQTVVVRGSRIVALVADLVLLAGDPLADVWNVTQVEAVLANGRYFDRAALDRLEIEAGVEWRKQQTPSGAP